MKKVFALIATIITVQYTMAQVWSGDRVNARKSIYLKDHSFKRVARDSTTMNDSAAIPTGKAVYDFIMSHSSPAGVYDINIKLSDTFLFAAPDTLYVDTTSIIQTFVTGGDTTVFETVIDSTGQPAQRVLFGAGNNKVGSQKYFLWDTTNHRLIINNQNENFGDTSVRIAVHGNALINGTVNVGAYYKLPYSSPGTGKVPVSDGIGNALVWADLPNTTGLATQMALNDTAAAIRANMLIKDTVYAKQPLYVDAGVKDTLKFNADSSGLVKDVMRSNDSVYIKINGVWEFAFIDSVGEVTDTSLLVHKAGKEIITGSKEFRDSLVILNPNNATSGTDLFDAPRFKLSSSGWNSALSAPLRQNVYIRHVPVKQTALSDSARAGTIYFSSKTGLQARPTPYDGAYITLDGNWGTTLGIVGGSYMNVNMVSTSTLTGSNISLGFGALTCTQNDSPTSGNFNLSKIKRTGIVNTTPSYTTTSKFIEYNMEINNTNANTMVVRGFEFNPILTNTTNTDLKAIVTTAGDSYFNTSSGAIGVGVSGTINSSAKLEVASTTKGFLPPRMTGSQAEAISSPAEGLMIYSTDGSGSTITSKGWWGYDGATWVKLN